MKVLIGLLAFIIVLAIFLVWWAVPSGTSPAPDQGISQSELISAYGRNLLEADTAYEAAKQKVIDSEAFILSDNLSGARTLISEAGDDLDFARIKYKEACLIAAQDQSGLMICPPIAAALEKCGPPMVGLLSNFIDFIADVREQCPGFAGCPLTLQTRCMNLLSQAQVMDQMCGTDYSNILSDDCEMMAQRDTTGLDNISDMK